LTVGLSVASRSITNLKTSQDQADSQKALAAAEAGVDRVLSDPALIANPPSNITIGDSSYDVKYTTSVIQSSGLDKYLLNGGYRIAKNHHVDIWPAKSSDTDLWTNPWSGQITLYWGEDTNGCNDPALEVMIVSGTDINNPTLTRYAYDPCSDRAGHNGFDKNVVQNQNKIGAATLQYQVTVPKVNNTLLFIINPLYVDNSYIGASANAGYPLPPQGLSVASTGMVQDSVQMKVNAFKDLPQLPDELLYSIFSP